MCVCRFVILCSRGQEKGSRLGGGRGGGGCWNMVSECQSEGATLFVYEEPLESSWIGCPARGSISISISISTSINNTYNDTLSNLCMLS